MKRVKSKKFIFIITGIITISVVFVFALVYFKYIVNKPNIILITIDALRHDHLGCAMGIN